METTDAVVVDALAEAAALRRVAIAMRREASRVPNTRTGAGLLAQAVLVELKAADLDREAAGHPHRHRARRRLLPTRCRAR